MAQATSQRYSTRVLHSDGSQGSQPNLITVKDAARRLGASRTTVYRIDRNDGPFRFVVDGRRIFIENASFEAFLANTGRNGTESELTADDVPLDCPQEEQPERTDFRTDDMPVEESRPTPPGDVPSPVSSSGQREYIPPRHYVPGLLWYHSLQG